VKGVPDRTISLAQLAGIAESRAGGPGPIIGEGHTAPVKNSPGFVVHLTKVQVDPATGQVEPNSMSPSRMSVLRSTPCWSRGRYTEGSSRPLGWACTKR